jgi:carbon storage regulator
VLVLGRKVGGQIQVGDDITITLVRISGSEGRIGIEAPDGVRIVRTELLESGEER